MTLKIKISTSFALIATFKEMLYGTVGISTEAALMITFPAETQLSLVQEERSTFEHGFFLVWTQSLIIACQIKLFLLAERIL